MYWLRLNKVLPTTALFLWLLSLLNSKLVIGDYGLIQSLSPLYFVALALLSLSFSLPLRAGSHTVKMST